MSVCLTFIIYLKACTCEWINIRSHPWFMFKKWIPFHFILYIFFEIYLPLQLDIFVHHFAKPCNNYGPVCQILHSVENNIFSLSVYLSSTLFHKLTFDFPLNQWWFFQHEMSFISPKRDFKPHFLSKHQKDPHRINLFFLLQSHLYWQTFYC